MSFFQLVRITVFLSISSFSMKELPKWCSNIYTEKKEGFREVSSAKRHESMVGRTILQFVTAQVYPRTEFQKLGLNFTLSVNCYPGDAPAPTRLSEQQACKLRFVQKQRFKDWGPRAYGLLLYWYFLEGGRCTVAVPSAKIRFLYTRGCLIAYTYEHEETTSAISRRGHSLRASPLLW